MKGVMDMKKIRKNRKTNVKNMERIMEKNKYSLNSMVYRINTMS